MAGALFPNVPKTAGVPAVRRSSVNSGTETTRRLTQDSKSVQQAARDQWGVYTTGGALAIQPDNIAAVGYNAESRLADYPIERGGFETYDKVQTPFETRVRMTKGGTVDDRRAFLQNIEKRRVDRELYNVVTPEATYLNVNIDRVALDRDAASGANLLTVDLHLSEVRESVKLTFSQTRSPASAGAVNNGSVQTKGVSPAPTGVR